MGKSVYKKLIITAFVTSIAFGGFAALNFYIFRELNPLPFNRKFIVIRSEGADVNKTSSAGWPKHNIRLPAPSPLNNSLFTTGGMLIVWLLNIGILLFIEKTNITTQKRSLIRYISSYTIIILIIVTYTSLNKVERTFTKLNNISDPGPLLGSDSLVFSGSGPSLISDSGHTVVSGSVSSLIPGPDPSLLSGDGPGIISTRSDSSFRVGFSGGQIPFMTAIIVNTIVIAILELILLQHHKSQVDLENAQLKMNHLLARHQHLKHQLHPHFLFNSLNTLKSLIKKSPGEAELYLVKLSGFLRSSLTMNDLNIIALQDELQLCIDYMEMQKMRFGNAFNYTIEIPKTVLESVSVPAFSIQLLIENAIKHNVLTIEDPLTVSISYNYNGYIYVKNNKKLKNIHEPSSAIGLKNLSERYKMISGSDIMITENDKDFTVEIQVLVG